MKSTRSQYFKQLHRRPALWLAWAAAVLYSSWPLGYVLNPVVGKHQLASQLEALHQPYAWLFIAMDVLTGVTLMIVGIWQIRQRVQPLWMKWCASSYVAFGVFDATAALAPLNCDPEAHTCGPLLHNPLMLIHGIASILSPTFLAIAIGVLGVALYRKHMGRLTRWLFAGTTAAWLVSGIGTLVELWMHVTGNALQYYFITVCSLSVVLVVGAIEYTHLRGQQLELTDADTA